jgi:hypothetical protein
MLCPACGGRVDLQATVCSECSFDIAMRDPAQMVVRARRDRKIAIGMLLIGVAGAVLCVALFSVVAPDSTPVAIVGLPPGAAIVGLGLGTKRLRSALRRLAVARTMERVPSARVVSDRR